MASAAPRATRAPRNGVLAAAAVLGTVFSIIYLPDLGHGFISDDFRWIVESRVADTGDLIALFSANVGFYRPVVSASFAADHALWGTSAFFYGLTNFGLCLTAAVLLFFLARHLGLPGQAALIAAGVWLFNFHAVNMALLWLSGRTALLATLFALLTAHAVVRARYRLAGLACLVAMLSKEEAVALPALFTAFLLAAARRSPVVPAATVTRQLIAAASETMPLWAALAVYGALRLQSGAFWPGDAPSFYRFSFAPEIIGRNLLEYADRAGTVAAAVGLALLAVTRTGRPQLADAERRALMLAGVWVPSTYFLTIFLPVRSSLYALLPSVGSALAVGALASAVARGRPGAVRKLGVVLVLVTILLIPVYRARNVRWVQLAELSAHVMATLERAARGRFDAGHAVLIDAPGERFNLAAAFGSLLPEAMRLYLGAGWTGELLSTRPETRRAADLTFELRHGVLLEIEGDAGTP
jgi:hypothetical protein